MSELFMRKMFSAFLTLALLIHNLDSGVAIDRPRATGRIAVPGFEAVGLKAEVDTEYTYSENFDGCDGATQGNLTVTKLDGTDFPANTSISAFWKDTAANPRFLQRFDGNSGNGAKAIIAEIFFCGKDLSVTQAPYILYLVAKGTDTYTKEVSIKLSKLVRKKQKLIHSLPTILEVGKTYDTSASLNSGMYLGNLVNATPSICSVELRKTLVFKAGICKFSYAAAGNGQYETARVGDEMIELFAIPQTYSTGPLPGNLTATQWEQFLNKQLSVGQEALNAMSDAQFMYTEMRDDAKGSIQGGGLSQEQITRANNLVSITAGIIEDLNVKIIKLKAELQALVLLKTKNPSSLPSQSPTPTPSTSSTAKASTGVKKFGTIRCQKGKKVKKIMGYNPTCPKGFTKL